MKNKWLDTPTEEGHWWRKNRPKNEVSMTFVEVRKNNPTFPKIVHFMNGRREHVRDLPYIQWQKVRKPDEN
jgi:hypothetical protein